MPNYLNGTNGSNAYQYNLGAGDTIITDTGLTNDIDILVLSGAGLTAANIIVRRVGTSNDLKITFKNIPGSILLKNQLDTNNGWNNNGLERLTFSDGVSWNESQLWNAYLVAGATTDDLLYGTDGNDLLVGGKGNDTLDGGSGFDTYRYQLGDGDDIIADTGYDAQFQDRLVFSGAGLTSANAIVTRIGTTTDLKITFKNLAGSVLLKNQLATNWTRNNGIEQITFSDGVFWSESKLWNAYLGAGLSTNDTLEGTIGNDVLVGGRGNDYLDGSEGSDLYKYQLGDGDDTLFDTGYDKYTSDQLVFSGAGLTAANAVVSRIGTTTDLKISFKMSAGSVLLKNQLSLRWDHANGIEQVTFSDGVLWNESQLWNAYLGAGAATNDTLEGTIGNDIFLGGKGNDYLDGGDGSDIYKYQLGDGDDTLFDTGYEKDHSDQLVFSGTGLTAANAIVTRIGTTTDLKITFKNIAGSVLLKNQFTDRWDHANGIERITFSDGVMWNEPRLWSAILGTTSSTTTNNIVGTGLNDTLVGSSGNDYFEGRRGNDLLKGDGGADIYRYNLGDGDDVVSDFSGYDLTLSHDQLLFSGAGLTAANAIVTHINDTNHLKITFKGIAGSVLLSDQVYRHTSQFTSGDYYNNYGVESVTFSDGVVWTESQLWNAYLGAGAATNDQLWGMASDDVMLGGKGNDYLNGWQGSDTYLYRLGDGDDTIVDSSNLNNTIDQIIFSGTGLTAANAIVTHIGNTNNLKISFKNIAGSILLTDQVYVHTSGFNVTSVIGDCGVERVTFSDGVVWDESQLWNAYLGAGLATDDQLWGMTSDDVIMGGKGNDYLNGWQGADTYRYQLGDGNDTLVDTGADNVVDQLVFSGAGLTAANAIVTQIANTMDLKISFKNSSGSVLLQDQLASFNILYSNTGVESVTFSDGLVWDNAQLVSAYLGLGAATDDQLQGTFGEDILVGGAGNDVLMGGGGSDLYRYQLGDGNDIVSDFGNYGNSSTDQLVLSGSGLTIANVIVTQIGTTNDLKLTFKNITGSIVLKEQLNPYDATHGIESIIFSDGAVWNESQLINAYLTLGADTDDQLWGTSGNDTLFGGRGNDVMTGNAGVDSFVFDGKGVFNTLNLGLDRITDFTSGTDKLVFAKSTFTALTSSVNTALNASEFAVINEATNGTAIASGSTSKVVFNRANGDLFYNQNGSASGLGSGARFATLAGGASLSATDILLRA